MFTYSCVHLLLSCRHSCEVVGHAIILLANYAILLYKTARKSKSRCSLFKLSQLMQRLKSAQCSYCHRYRQLDFELQTYTIPWTPFVRVIALCSKVSFYGADSEI